MALYGENLDSQEQTFLTTMGQEIKAFIEETKKIGEDFIVPKKATKKMSEYIALLKAKKELFQRTILQDLHSKLAAKAGDTTCPVYCATLKIAEEVLNELNKQVTQLCSIIENRDRSNPKNEALKLATALNKHLEAAVLKHEFFNQKLRQLRDNLNALNMQTLADEIELIREELEKNKNRKKLTAAEQAQVVAIIANLLK